MATDTAVAGERWYLFDAVDEASLEIATCAIVPTLGFLRARLIIEQELPGKWAQFGLCMISPAVLLTQRYKISIDAANLAIYRADMGLQDHGFSVKIVTADLKPAVQPAEQGGGNLWDQVIL